MPARRTIRRRRRVDSAVGEPPPSWVLNPDGSIPFTGAREPAFASWLASAHPEIDPLDDLLVGALLEDDLADRTAAEIVAHYCDPAAHADPTL